MFEVKRKETRLVTRAGGAMRWGWQVEETMHGAKPHMCMEGRPGVLLLGLSNRRLWASFLLAVGSQEMDPNWTCVGFEVGLIFHGPESVTIEP